MSERERWRPIPGYEGIYEVSDFGRVYSLKRTDRLGRKWGGYFMRLTDHPKGTVIAVNLAKDGTLKKIAVHRLVLSAFRGPCPEGMQGCHFPDRNPENCRLDNLRWDTVKANHADKIVHGTMPRGERHPRSKFTNTDIERMFDLRKCGCTYRQITNWFSRAGEQTTRRIINGESWKHLERA